MAKGIFVRLNNLRDALNNFTKHSGASDDYCYGMVVGLVAGLMAARLTFNQALTLVWDTMPQGVDFRLGRVMPSSWPTRGQLAQAGDEGVPFVTRGVHETFIPLEGLDLDDNLKRVALVYQAGIANLFMVECWNLAPFGRDAIRLSQSDFNTVGHIALGMALAGCAVRTFACNQAGDIIRATWSDDLDSAPFHDKFIIVDTSRPRPNTGHQPYDRVQLR